MPGSPRFAVAIHVLAVLAFIERKGGERVSSSQIAMSVNTNPVVIRNLLKALKDAGLIRVKEGRGGGIRLGRKPSQISLAEIHRAVAKDVPIFAQNERPIFTQCPVSRGMHQAFANVTADVEAAVSRALRGRTLDEVVGDIL